MKKIFALMLVATIIACITFAGGCAQPSATPESTLPAPTSGLASTTAEPSAEPDAEPAGVPLLPDAEHTLDVNGDGVFDKFHLIKDNGDEETEASVKLSIEFGGQTEKKELPIETGFFESAYLYTEGEKTLFIVSVDFASSDYQTSVFTFNEENILKKISTKEGFGYSLSKDELTMFAYVYALGTWATNCVYKVSAESGLTPLEEPMIYTIREEGRSLTTAKELPCYLYDANGGAPVLSSIEAGVKLLPKVVYGDNRFEFELSDGRSGYIQFTKSDGDECLIDGKPDSEWFTQVEYYG